MKLVSLFAGLLLSTIVSGQVQKITGQIMDASTSEELPFAHVYLEGTHYGTLSNVDGFYELIIPEGKSRSRVVFSYVGYNTQVIELAKFDNGTLTIKLESTPQLLDQVIVTTLDAEQIWKKASKQIVKNYINYPHRLSGFYRTTFQEDGYFSKLLEAAVNVHGASSPRRKAQLEYMQIRKSKDLRKNVWESYEGYLEHLVNNHPLRRIREVFPPLERSEDTRFQIKDVLYQDEDIYYVVHASRAESQGQHDVEMMIREGDFAVFRITLFWHPQNSGDYSWAWERREYARFFCDWQESVYEYQEIDGEMYPRRSSWHRKGRVISIPEEETIFHTESIDELLITNIEKGKFPFENRIEVRNNVYQMADYFPYDQRFWETYNRPVDSDYFRKAKSRMEDHQPLEDQFRESSGQSAISSSE